MTRSFWCGVALLVSVAGFLAVDLGADIRSAVHDCNDPVCQVEET